MPNNIENSHTMQSLVHDNDFPTNKDKDVFSIAFPGISSWDGNMAPTAAILGAQ